MSKPAERLFDGWRALSSAEDEIIDALEAAGMGDGWNNLWWDDYDTSLEFGVCLPEFRLPPAAVEKLWELGFFRCWINHSDNTNTYYQKGAEPVTYPREVRPVSGHMERSRRELLELKERLDGAELMGSEWCLQIVDLQARVKAAEEELALTRRLARRYLYAEEREARAKLKAETAEENFSESRREVGRALLAIDETMKARAALQAAAARPHEQPCPQCGGPRIRSEQWDAYYCAPCNVWLEKGCSATTEEQCPFRCWQRPATPL